MRQNNRNYSDAFTRTALAMAAGSRRLQTAKLYRTTQAKVLDFMGGVDPFFDDITPTWLKAFDRWMESNGLKVNSRGVIMRHLRAIVNRAIDDGLTDTYAFRRYTIKTEPTRKKALTVEQLRNFFTAPIPEWAEKYRDCMLLSFLLRGVNMADLLTWDKTALYDGRIEASRVKTGAFYSIKVEPEAMALIKRYKGRRNLLSFAEGCKSHMYFFRTMSREISALFPGISSYSMRHSWATICSELGIPVEVIAQGLAHQYGPKVTAIYIRPSYERVDAANRQVIDYVFNGL